METVRRVTEKAKGASQELDTSDLLLAILTLLVDEREQRAGSQPGLIRTELLLSRAGLPHATIARILSKSPDAVRVMIARATAKPRSSQANKQDEVVSAKDG